MDNKDIKTLIKVLLHKKRNDLALLLNNCSSCVEESGQYGSRFNSIISTFLIYAQVEQYYKLKELSEKDREVILSSVLDIYPVVDEEPEITSIEFRLSREEDYEKKELSTYIGRTVRVFISYATNTTQEREFAGDFKRALERFGLEVFLAHEDINPSSDWQEAIIENLKSNDIFMPIITENFRQSLWTDQESGMAVIEKKLIIPVAVDGHVPYGFLGKFQAYRQDSKLPISVSKIVEAIMQRKPELAISLLDSLIKSFAASFNYDDAGLKSSLLLKFDTMTAEQANEVFRSILLNGQIYESMSAHENINKLFEKYQHLLDKKLLERVRNQEGLLEQSVSGGDGETIDVRDIPF